MLQTKTFLGGMDSDSSEEMMEANSDRYRLNCRVLSSQNSNIGNIVTTNGNDDIYSSPFTLPTGVNTVIGSYEDILQKKVYYFVHNSTNLHSILEYDSVANSIAKVFQDGVVGNQANILNFSLDYLITGINVVLLTETARLLYWTDNYNEPRKINIQKGKLYMLGSPGGYPTAVPFDPRILYRIKQPMLLSPLAIYGNDISVGPVNLLLNNLFQFKVQFVYDDYELSAWSPVSKTPYPAYGTTVTFVDNVIDITVGTGMSIVTAIRIAVKKFTDADFRLVEEINKLDKNLADDLTYVYKFYNDGNYIPLEINESIKLFDNVPKLSQSQDIIFGNRLVDGLITEGYDNVDIDLKLNYTLGSADVSLKRGGDYLYGIIYYDHANRSGVTNINSGKFNEIQVNGSYGTNLILSDYTDATDGFIVITFTNVVGAPFLVGDEVTTDAFTQTGIITSISTIGVGQFSIVIGSLVGNWLPVAYGPLIINNTSGAFADFGLVGTLPIVGGAPIVDFTIYNSAPSWAKSYQIARTKNVSNTGYLQWVAHDPTFIDSAGTPVAYSAFTAVQLRLNILDITDEFLVANPNSILVYDYVKGDRVKIYYTNATAAVYPTPAGFLSAFIDLEVVKYDSATGYLWAKLPDSYNNVYPTEFPFLQGSTLIELYHTNLAVLETDRLTYEIGQGGDISLDSNSGLYVHEASNVNQSISVLVSATYGAPPTFNAVLTLGHGLVALDEVKITTSGYSVYGIVSSSAATSAVITTTTTLVGTFSGVLGGFVSKGAKADFTGGDTFYRVRDMLYGSTGIQDYGFSDTFLSDSYDYGRPNRIDKNNREITRPSTVVYSEQLVPETFINGLSSVFDTNFETYENKYGGIYKMYAKDQRLILFQELKVGAIPIQQNIFQGTQGGSVVGASTQILSPSAQYYADEFGIGKNPESFAVYGNSIYFMDMYRLTPVRLAQNGLTPIGRTAKMSDYFIKKCKSALALSQQVRAYGVYDVEFGEYVLMFGNIPSVFTGETLSFNEASNTWNTFYSYVGEGLCSNSGGIVSFKSGVLWKHNINALQNNFYDVQYTSDVWLVLNENPLNVKIFTAIEEDSDKIWEVPSITNSEGQLSNLISADFEVKENLQYAPLWKDANTPNVAVGTGLFQGDPMRSRTFLVKLKYTGTSISKLFAVNLRYIISNLHNR